MKNEKLNLLARFASFFIKNYQVSILVIVFIIIGGVYGYFQSPRQGMPEINIPYALVNTIYPGATPEQIEKEVTTEIENSIDNIDNVKNITSGSGNSISTVFVEFEADADLDKALDNLRREVSAIKKLPEGAEDPVVTEISADSPDLIFNIVGNGTREEMSEAAEIYKKEIAAVDGIDSVEVWGGIEEEVFINLDSEKLEKTGISYDQISQVIAGANLNIPGGNLEEDESSLPIQVSGKFESLEDIKEIVIGVSPFTGIVKLKDVAEIEKQNKLEENIYQTGYIKNDKMVSSNTIAIIANAKATEDVIRVNNKVHEKVAELEESGEILSTVESIVVYDVSRDVKTLLGDLFSNAWQGLIAILIVLLIFISFRSSIVAAFIIPLVLLSAFVAFIFVDVLTLNFLTLFSLILALGIVIDNAIVIVEGVQRKIKEGYKRVDAAILAVQDLGPALIAATATTVLVFVPMLFLGGITGQFVKYIPYTVIITLIGSILIALSLTPFLSRSILSSHAKEQKRAKKKKAWKATEKCILGFCKIVTFLLKRKFRIFASFIIVGVLILSSSMIATKLDVQLWPVVDDAEYFQIEVKYEKNSSQEVKKEKIKDLSSHMINLHTDNAIVKENVVGFSPFSYFQGGEIEGQSTFLVNLVKSEKATVNNSELIDIIQKDLDSITGAEYKVSGLAQGPPAAEFPIEIQIANENSQNLEKAALELSNFLSGLEGVKKVDNGVDGEKSPQVVIELDKEKIAEAGLIPIQVAGAVRNIYNPQTIAEYTDSETNEGMDIKLGFSDNSSLEDLKKIKVGNSELQDLATIEKVEVLKSINHYDGKKYLEVRASLEEGYAAADINKKVQDYFTEDKLAALNLESSAISYRGDMESEEQAFADFGMLTLFSLIAIYALLAFQFKSFAQPFIIMLAIPLAVIGVFPALLITGQPISFLAMIGIVVLMGIVVNNSIILIDRINKLREEKNLDLRGAITEGVNQRTRPIFATTLTTIAGILPLTLTESYWRGMGTTIISGLIASAIFVLIIIPVVYYLYIAILVKINQKFKK